MDNQFYDKNYLKNGTLINNKYIVETILGSGAFSIAYRAHLSSDKDVKFTVKEFFPLNIVYRNIGENSLNIVDGRLHEFEKDRNLFRNEFENLNQIKNEDGIVRPVEYFEDNKTNYIVSEYKEGLTFSDYLNSKNRKLNLDEILEIVYPLMDIVQNIHQKYKMYHKDIRPENILVEKGSNKVFLIDFGLACHSLDEQRQSITVKISEGYSPLEQYQKDSFLHGPWMDVYSIAAIIYKALTGKRIPSVFDRIDITYSTEREVLRMPSQLGVKINYEVEKVIKTALEIYYEKRFSSVKLFKETLLKTVETTKNGVYDIALLEYKKITKINPPSILKRVLYKKFETNGNKDLLKSFDKIECLKGVFYTEIEELLLTALSTDGKNSIFNSIEEFKELLHITYYNMDDKVYKIAKHKYKKYVRSNLKTPLKRYYLKGNNKDWIYFPEKLKMKKTTEDSLKRALSLDLDYRYSNVRDFLSDFNSKLPEFISRIVEFYKKLKDSDMITYKYRRILVIVLFITVITSISVYYTYSKLTSYGDKIIFVNTKPELNQDLEIFLKDIDKDVIVCDLNEYNEIYKGKTDNVIKMVDEDDVLLNKNKNHYFDLKDTECIKKFSNNISSDIDFIKNIVFDKNNVITSTEKEVIAIPFSIEGFGMIYNKNNIDSKQFKDKILNDYSSGIIRDEFIEDLKLLKKEDNPPIAILPLDWLYGRHYVSIALVNNGEKDFVNSYNENKYLLEEYSNFEDVLNLYQSILEYNLLHNNDEYERIEREYFNLISLGETDTNVFSEVETDLYNSGINIFAEEGVFCISGTWIWPHVEKSIRGTELNKDEFGIIPIPISNNENGAVNNNIVCGITKYLVVDKIDNPNTIPTKIVSFLNKLALNENQKELCNMGILPPFYNFKSSESLKYLNSDDPLLKSMISMINNKKALYYKSIDEKTWKKIGLEMQYLYKKKQGVNWTFDRIRIYLGEFMSDEKIFNPHVEKLDGIKK